MPTQKATPHEIRTIAVKCNLDTRTVSNWLTGVRVQNASAALIAMAVSNLGLGHLATEATQIAHAKTKAARS